MNVDIRERFAAIAALPDSEIALDEAALLIAAEADPDVNVGLYLSKLDEIAERFERNVVARSAFGVSISSLSDFIHRDEAFSGNVRDYYAPENSYLNRVLDTRSGIPISLALVHISVGKRLKLPVSGVNFPGHFLVRYGQDKRLIVDPFSGRILSEPDCATLLKQIAGPRAVVQPHYLDAADNKSVLLRILDNLKQIFWRNRAWDESQRCLERQLLLRPAQYEFNVQLGAVYEMQGNVGLARHTYTSVLQLSEDEQVRSLASQRLLALEPTHRIIH